jgi:hypothetical protein
MKYFALILIGALAIGSCSSPVTKVAETDTTEHDTTVNQDSSFANANSPSAISSLCFLHTEGTRNQDTTTIELVIKGDTVTGEMNWLPGLKDGRRGLLSGKKTGDKINAMWTFKQEGMTDSMAVAFKLTGNQLAQKPLKTDPKTGRQSTDDAADYTILYHSSNTLRAK